MNRTFKSVSVSPEYQKSLFFLIGRRFHLGKYSSFRNGEIMVYLLGTRNNIDYFSGIITVVHLKVALRFYWKRFSSGLVSKVLFFRQQPVVSIFVSKIKSMGKAFLTRRWPAGIIGNWHVKVSVPFLNYQLTAPYLLNGSEHNRYLKLLKGFSCLVGKPDLVIFLEFPGSAALKDCWLNGVPTIAVIDSNSRVMHCSYIIPSSSSGLVQCVILSLFLEV
jgi:ribosomal protein S2